MTWYRAGSITAINGNVIVTGDATMWNSRAKAGEALLGPDGQLYEIGTINSDTQLTLTTPYGGPSVTGSAYVIVPTQSYMRVLAGQVTELITLYSELPDSAYEAGQSASDAAQAAQDAAAAKNTAVASKEQAEQKAGEATTAAASASTSAGTASTGATTATIKASEAVLSQIAAAAAQLIAETARDAAVATANLRSSLSAALADSSIVVGATFTYPLSDGSIQAARKDSPSAATSIGAPFASSQAVLAAATAAAGSTAYLGYLEVASTKGSTAPNTTTITSGFTYGCGVPTPSLGRVPTFYVRMSAGGTGEVHFYTPNSSGGYDTAEILPVTVATGENAIPLTTSARYWPAGTVIHYNRLTGGWPRYDAGGLGSVVSSTAQVKGSPLVGTLNPAYGNTIAIAYDFVGSPNATVSTRLGAIENGATEKQKNLAAAAGVTGETVAITAYGDTSPNSTTITAGFTYGCKYAAPASGFLESFSVRLSAAGTGQVIVYEDDGGGNFKVVAAVNVTAVTGLNTFTGFNNLFIKRGARVQYRRITSGYPRYVAGGDGSFVMDGDGSAHTVGATVTGKTNANTMAIAFSIRAAAAALADRVDSLAASMSALVTAAPAPSSILESTQFAGTTLPADWIAPGWTANDGLNAPSTVGWGVSALGGKGSSIGRRRVFARFRPSDSSSVFGICSNQSSGGLAAFINGTGGKLQLYSWTGGSTAGTLISEVALPSTISVGRPYSLDIVKNGLTIVVKFIDNTTLQTASITSTSIAAQLHGRAGVMQIAGAPVVVESFDHLVLYDKRVRAVILGDSNLEGTALSTGQKSWGYQLAAMRSENDIVVAGRAGDTTPNFMVQRRATDLKSWESARYVLIALGTNDTNHDSWRTNITTMIADCILIGAEPILCTMPPRPSDQTVKSLMNADIRGHYFGRYRYVDFATALSVNQDSVTWDSLLQTGDNVHSNLAGQQRMAAQVLADLPLLVA